MTRDQILAVLSPRRLDVLALLCRGHTVKRMARMLDLPASTVNEDIRAICKKLGVRSRPEVAVIAAKAGLV